jgi:hypothetical protein
MSRNLFIVIIGLMLPPFTVKRSARIINNN